LRHGDIGKGGEGKGKCKREQEGNAQ
jgi:hypothetical protein